MSTYTVEHMNAPGGAQRIEITQQEGDGTTRLVRGKTWIDDRSAAHMAENYGVIVTGPWGPVGNHGRTAAHGVDAYDKRMGR